MRREPPKAVWRELAEEVGFGCPVEGCGSPYLTWHHFDPPWAEREHHDPAGMVALCRDHHPEADAGAFTVDQLRELKRVGRDRSKRLGSKFSWMREDLLAVVGGNFYFRTPIAVQFNDTPVVWFNRDEGGRLLVNFNALTTSGQPRIGMVDNVWSTEGSDEVEIVAPPSGRLISARYPNGDRLRIEFREVVSVQDFERRFPPPKLPAAIRKRFESNGMDLPDLSHRSPLESTGLQFPIAVVEITQKVVGSGINFGPKGTAIGGGLITGGWMGHQPVGLQISG